MQILENLGIKNEKKVWNPGHDSKLTTETCFVVYKLSSKLLAQWLRKIVFFANNYLKFLSWPCCHLATLYIYKPPSSKHRKLSKITQACIYLNWHKTWIGAWSKAYCHLLAVHTCFLLEVCSYVTRGKQVVSGFLGQGFAPRLNRKMTIDSWGKPSFSILAVTSEKLQKTS